MSETEVVCVARNNSQLDGLLTVFHTERSADGLSNVQNELPALNPEDKAALKDLARDFEIDFVSLSFTRHARDLEETRDFLSSIGLGSTKVGPSAELTEPDAAFWQATGSVGRLQRLAPHPQQRHSSSMKVGGSATA